MILFALLFASSSGGASTTRVDLVAPDHVSEDAGTIELRASRGGDTTVAFKVDYFAVPNGTAVPSVNFLPVQGTLTFSPAQQDAFFHIPILNDGVVVPEGFTTFGVYLTNATAGVEVGTDVSEVSVQDIQWPPTLDLEYQVPVQGYFYSWQSAPNGQLVGWNGTELVRINADGAIDVRFPLVLDATDDPRLIVQPDGRFLIVDSLFTSINGVKVPRSGFARLNADGSLDGSFVPTILPAHVVWPLANGRILIHDGTSLWALNASGQVDLSFHADGVAEPRRVLETGEGKLILAADSSVIRLSVDGSLDSTFSPAQVDGDVSELLLQPDGRILVSGSFNSISGHSRSGLVRLNPSGVIDETFVPYVNEPGRITLDGEKIIVFDGDVIYRLHPDGNLDEAFAVRLHAKFEGPRVYWMKLYGGRLYINGYFFEVNGSPRPGVARLLLDEAPGTAAVIAPDRIYNFTLQYWNHGFEGMGAAAITVRRIGDVRGPATVSYNTRDGSAKAGQDYAKVSGALSFAPFEMEKTFQLPILDDSAYEPDETLELLLSPASGVISVAPPTTFVIHDDEVRIQSLQRDGSGFDLFFNAVPGGEYALEASNNLIDWILLDRATGDQAQYDQAYFNSFRVQSLTPLYRFYRIMRTWR